MKRLFIINPQAGKNITEFQITELKQMMKKRSLDFNYITPTSRSETIIQTQTALKSDINQIIVIGGDGTLNAVINGFFENEMLLSSETSVVVTNFGSGCDYYKTIMKNSTHQDWKNVIFENHQRSVDIGVIHYSQPNFKTQYFINMASLGLVPEIVNIKNNKFKKWPASVKYVLPTIMALSKSSSPTVQIIHDHGVWTERILTLTISKGQYAGGGMKFGTQSLVDDSLFDVTLFPKLKLPVTLKNFPKLYTGSFINVPGIKKIKTTKLAIKSTETVAVEFDGDAYGTTDVEISVVPKAIHVCWPL